MKTTFKNFYHRGTLCGIVRRASPILGSNNWMVKMGLKRRRPYLHSMEGSRRPRKVRYGATKQSADWARSTSFTEPNFEFGISRRLRSLHSKRLPHSLNRCRHVTSWKELSPLSVCLGAHPSFAPSPNAAINREKKWRRRSSRPFSKSSSSLDRRRMRNRDLDAPAFWVASPSATPSQPSENSWLYTGNVRNDVILVHLPALAATCHTHKD